MDLDLPSKETVVRAKTRKDKWERLKDRDVKINFDGASKGNPSNTTVVRDDRYQYIIAFCQRNREN